MHCIKTVAGIITVFSTTPSLYFLSPSGVTKFQGEPLGGDVKDTGEVGKISNFRPICQCILETVPDRPWLLWNVPFPVTLSDIEWLFQHPRNSKAIISLNPLNHLK